jgi:hypothetical protein
MNAWRDDISHEMNVSKELHADINLPKIQLMSQSVNRFLDTEHCTSILPKVMNQHIKRITGTVGTPPITISTTYRK